MATATGASVDGTGKPDDLSAGELLDVLGEVADHAGRQGRADAGDGGQEVGG